MRRHKQYSREVFLNYLFGWVGSYLLYTGFSLVAESGGCSPVALQGLLIAVASIVAEHGLDRCGTQA